MKLLEIFEATTKHVTFCFGRMNPPTIGHKQVLDTMNKQGGDMKVFVSQSQDAKKNPLDYATKINFIKKMFPEYADKVVDDAGLNTVVKVASYLYDQGYNAATFIAGSDRLEDMKKLLEAYNGVEGKAHGYYKFEVLDFVSSGDREDGAEGVAGVSASGARAAAANNDFEGFKEATGADELAKPLFAAVRKGMNITENKTVNELKSKDSRPEDNFTIDDIKSLEKETDLETIKARAKEMVNKASKKRMKAEKILWFMGAIDRMTSKMALIKLMYDLYLAGEGHKVIGSRHSMNPNSYRQRFGDDINVGEAPIEMDPSDPMDPMIYGAGGNPAKLKYRMLRAAGQIKDLASRVDKASPGEWQTMTRQFEELKMNMEQIRHALEELAKIRKKGGLRSRGIDPMIDSVDEGWKQNVAAAALAAANLLGTPAQAAEEPAKPITIAYVMIDGEMRKYNLGDKFDNAKEAEEFISRVLDKQGLQGYQLEIKHGYAKKQDKKESVEEGYGRYWCSTDKKWKTRKGPKQSRKS